MTSMEAKFDHPIHELLAQRWSPVGFSSEKVPQADLCSLFEAARWAASSYNEQSWRFIVATNENPDEHEKLLSCLVEGNQEWAKAAPVLVLGIVSAKFERNGKDNKAAPHDLGLGVGNLLVEATFRGLYAHQMIGILPDKAKELYQIPADYEVWTAIAIGYKADPDQLPEALRKRKEAPRQRKPLQEFVFSGEWDQASPWLERV